VLLEGDLGSGKTTLARAVIRTLMDDPKMDVPSPSFALVQPYEKGALSIVHADLYRLSDALELEELGITENPEAIVLVEWPERAPELATRADVRIQFELMEKGKSRRLALSSPSGQIDLNQLN
jgi:tRNA threonylcarbamoyladenosine biosynthesis protein TsaE